MSFYHQINDIFNQRRTGLLENERRALDYRKEELFKAYNSLYQLGLENNISISANVVDNHVSDGDASPHIAILRSTSFFVDLDEIIEMMRTGDLEDECNAFNDIQDAINLAHNKFVVEAGDNNALGVEVTVQVMNNQEEPPAHWQPAEPILQTASPGMLRGADEQELSVP